MERAEERFVIGVLQLAMSMAVIWRGVLKLKCFWAAARAMISAPAPPPMHITFVDGESEATLFEMFWLILGF